MGAVHIRISHDNDLVVTQLADIKVIVNTRTKGCDHGLNLCIGINLIHPGLFNI